MEFSGVTNGTTHHVLQSSSVSSASAEHHLASAAPSLSGSYGAEHHASDRSISEQPQSSRLYSLHQMPVNLEHHHEDAQLHPAEGTPGHDDWRPSPEWTGRSRFTGQVGLLLPHDVKQAIHTLHVSMRYQDIPEKLATTWNIHLTARQVHEALRDESFD